MASRRWRMLLAGVLAASGGVASVTAQGLPPVSIAAIQAGVQSCVAATSASGVDEAKLQAGGWHRATLTANGKPAANGLVFYSKDGVLLMLGKVCSITAHLVDRQDYLKLQAAMASAYGGPTGTDPVGEYIFFDKARHIIDLAPTGSVERPAARVAVGYVTQEKK